LLYKFTHMDTSSTYPGSRFDVPRLAGVRPKKSDYDDMYRYIDFNLFKEKHMKTIFHPADQRGHANHGWLDAHHSFSFGNSYDPERIHFGALRVLNDDSISGGKGFGAHPHDNMEIITIPLEGALMHKDNMGNSSVIQAGDIQVMSAGTGIMHSEFNADEKEQLKLLQIWLFPNQKQVTPRYQQITLDPTTMHNQLQQILSPNSDDAGVWIHQNAWFHLGEFEAGQTFDYKLKGNNHGIYTFVIAGKLQTNGQELGRRDALGIWETEQVSFEVREPSKVLIIEVPMEF
jgi:redox-sensitive bicupin YhaK (pirin superfamily)